MICKLIINFKKIKGIEINKKIIESTPIMIHTEPTVKKLCKEIDKYFKQYQIETKTEYKLKR